MEPGDVANSIPELRKFDMASITNDKVVLMIGSRCMGKFTLTRDLLYHHRDIPIGCIISPIEEAEKRFERIAPSLFIHDEYSSDIPANVLKRQKAVHRNEDYKDKDKRAFVILDDCFYDESWARDRNLHQLLETGRNLSTLIVLTMQFPMGITQTLRSQIDYVFIARSNLMGNRKRLYESYTCNVFPSFEVFCRVMDRYTDRFDFVVIAKNATYTSDRWEDRVFWYTAELHPPFKVGADEFWEMSRKAEADAANKDT